MCTHLRQVPGYVMGADVTDKLIAQGYFASYNIPYFPEIFNVSGCQHLVDQYGDWCVLLRPPPPEFPACNNTSRLSDGV